MMRFVSGKREAGSGRRGHRGAGRIVAALGVVLASAVFATGCDKAVGSEPVNQGHSYIVGIDISGSRNKTELDESKKLLDGLIDKLQAGDHLTLIEAYQGGRIPARQWSDSIRAPLNGKPTGCDKAVGSEPVNQGHSYIVGIDISGSRNKTELDESKKLLDGLIDKLQAGDHLTLIEAYQGGRIPARQWSDSIRAPLNGKPTASDKQRVEDFKTIARIQTSILFDSARAKGIMSTDIFGTLSRAADYAKASRNRPTTLLMLSDMMNETPDVTMTDEQGIPGNTWIRQRAVANRVPRLQGVCVVVAGADVSTERGAAIRDFWGKYFEAAGTRVAPDNYRNMISDPGEVACTGN